MPGWVAEAVQAVLDVEWPDADETAAWDLADRWYTAAALLVSPQPAAYRTGRDFIATHGPTGRTGPIFNQAWAQVADGADAPLTALVGISEAMGRLIEQQGRDMQAAKLEAWLEIGRFVVELTRLAVPVAFTLGAAAPAAATLVAATRQTIHQLGQQLAARLDGPPLAAPEPPPSDHQLALTRAQHHEVVRHFEHAAGQHDARAQDAARRAAEARHHGRTGQAHQFDQVAEQARAAHTDYTHRARTIRDNDVLLGAAGGPPDPTGPGWRPDGSHQPVPTIGAIDDRSALTGNDHPTPTDQTRRYGGRGGLRPPLPMLQADLAEAVPRDAEGQVTRLADPRVGTWFHLVNGDGPEADPTRATNDADVVLALYETYLHGRPRVAAPRTFDGYLDEEADRPLGAEADAIARIEAVTGGQFQGLCPDVRALGPRQAQQAVEHAYTNLQNHLLNSGHGSFAVLVARSEGGTAHTWAAVNHDGTILYLDPQSRLVLEHRSPYPHLGREFSGNVVVLDALVVDGVARYTPLPYHVAGPFSAARGKPTVPPRPAAVLADLVDRLLNTADDYPLVLTGALLDPVRRKGVLARLAELAAGRPLTAYQGSLRRFEVAQPGTGPLFELIPRSVDVDGSGVRRAASYAAAATAADPARSVGATPTDRERVLLAEYAARLQHRVVPAIWAELQALADAAGAGPDRTVAVSARAATADAILDRLQRAAAGQPGGPGRRCGDLPDTVSARVVASDMHLLGLVLGEIGRRFGVGDRGRILAVDNRYADPDPTAPEQRAVILQVAIEVDDRPYPVQVWLSTQRAELAAELAGNPGGRRAVDPVADRTIVATMRVAAASDQLETSTEGPR